MQTIVVTGALGLIGSMLVKKLSALQVKVILVDIRSTPHNPVGINILNYPVLRDVIKNCTGVIHLAAVSRVIWGEEHPQLCTDINVKGTKNIIDACIKSPKKPWLIYASSREVYGQQTTFPVSEECIFMPHNHYAKSKMQAENLVNAAKKAGLQVSTLRFSNVFGGVSDYAERVVPAFCVNALNNLPLQVNGADALLDFTYVEDVVKGITQAAQYLSIQHDSLPAMHFTTGKATSLLELAKLVVKLCNSASDIIVKPKHALYPSKFYGDYSRANALLGWQPDHDVQSGVIHYVNQLKANTAKLIFSTKGSTNENFESYSWLSA
jgi:dTDP-glucose 4,6-dehydratase